MNSANFVGQLVELVGTRVEQLRFDYSVTVVLGEKIRVRISTSFTLQRAGDSAVTVDPEKTAGRALLATHDLLHQRVEAAGIGGERELYLKFDNEVLLQAPFSNEFEAWQVDLPEGEPLISLPGGGFA